MNISELDPHLGNRYRYIKNRYEERSENLLKDLCVFGCSGLLCSKIKHKRHHDFNLDGILTLTQEDITNLDINKLICSYHQYRQSKKHPNVTSEKFELYLRAEIFCQLKNVRNLLGSLYFEKDKLKIENNINLILESKFTKREREGQFCEIEKRSSFKMAAILNRGFLK